MAVSFVVMKQTNLNALTKPWNIFLRVEHSCLVFEKTPLLYIKFIDL